MAETKKRANKKKKIEKQAPKEKKEKLLVSKKEVEKEAVETAEADEKYRRKEEEEPSWFHYAIVLGILVAIFAGLYFAFEFFNEDAKVEKVGLEIDLYKYEFQVDDALISFTFYNEIDEINQIGYPIEVTKGDLKNSSQIFLSFLEYNGTDNGEVVRTSGRMTGTIKGVFRVPFVNEQHIVRNNETNCSNATLSNKVIVFNPYSDRNGVFYDGEGCVTFETDDATKMKDVGDKFFLKMLTE